LGDPQGLADWHRKLAGFSQLKGAPTTRGTQPDKTLFAPATFVAASGTIKNRQSRTAAFN
jgi:hypothetical protein